MSRPLPIKVSMNVIPRVVRFQMRSGFPFSTPRLYLEGNFERENGEQKDWSGFVTYEVAAAILHHLKQKTAIKIARMEGSMVQKSIFFDNENAPLF